MIRVEAAASEADVERARELFREYQVVAAAPVCFTSFEQELSRLPDGYEAILIAWGEDGEAAGCVAWRALGAGVAEMKRLYAREAYRGVGVGRRLAEQAMADAQARGFARMRLDTLPHMEAAIAMYRRLGFREIERYNDNPEARALFFERDLV